MLPVIPPNGAEKCKTDVFGIKLHFARRKSATKFFLCENCQQRSCKAFIGLSIRAKMIGGGCPVKRKSCIKWTFPWRGSRADQRFQEIRRILYLHCTYYSGIWNY